eukprot:6204521-Pleurochrysis_carterae.AAC.1
MARSSLRPSGDLAAKPLQVLRHPSSCPTAGSLDDARVLVLGVVHLVLDEEVDDLLVVARGRVHEHALTTPVDRVGELRLLHGRNMCEPKVKNVKSKCQERGARAETARRAFVISRRWMQHAEIQTQKWAAVFAIH